MTKGVLKTGRLTAELPQVEARAGRHTLLQLVAGQRSARADQDGPPRGLVLVIHFDSRNRGRDENGHRLIRMVDLIVDSDEVRPIGDVSFGVGPVKHFDRRVVLLIQVILDLRGHGARGDRDRHVRLLKKKKNVTKIPKTN